MVRNPRKINSPRLPPDLEFRQVPGHSLYLVSIDGRFWTTAIDGEPAEKTLAERRSNKRTDKGAARMRLRVTHQGRVIMLDAASLACEAWHGPRPEGAYVAFLDGEMDNLAAENLGWRMADVKISDADFVRAWQTSHSMHEVAEKCGGMSVASVYHRAKALRGNGVRLKDIVRAKSDADALNALIDQMDG